MKRYDIEVVENAANVSNLYPKTAFEKVVADCMKDYLEYRKAEKQKLILRLPVAEGSMVYEVIYTLECKHKYDCSLEFDLCKCEAGISCKHEYKKYCIRETKFNYVMLSEIGETIFLTRKEAEEKIEFLN